jgi:Rrf2 family protein
MPLFSAKLDYALRAVIDIALQPPDEVCQSREIAMRQDIRGPYLDQILATLKREGIIRSIRGAGGGYTLARPPHQIRIGDIIRALVGNQLLVGDNMPELDPTGTNAAWIVRKFQDKMEQQLTAILDETTLADLVRQKQSLDESMSIMPCI